MNLYQLEVAEMDRRHRLMVRAVTFSGAAVLIVAALWSAGLPPSAWIEWASAWFAGLGEQEVTQVQTPSAAPPMPAVSTTIAQPTAEVLAGTDSSISPTPQPLYLVATSPGRNKNEGTAQIGVNPDIYGRLPTVK